MNYDRILKMAVDFNTQVEKNDPSKPSAPDPDKAPLSPEEEAKKKADQNRALDKFEDETNKTYDIPPEKLHYHFMNP